MQAARIHKYGSSLETLVVEEVPDPAPGPGQVLIENHASSVNPIDWKLAGGGLKLMFPLKFPAVLGFDLAGRVTAVGEGITKFKAGDEVYARTNVMPGGAYAEFSAVDADVVALKPAGMSFLEAAAVPLAALTAYQALRHKAELQSGQKVLINGASGGVGVYAVQIAKALGAHVTAVCSKANAELATFLGADEVIDYKTADPLSGTEPYHAIFDCVASIGYSKAKRRLAKGGTYISTLPDAALMLAGVFGFLSSTKAVLIVVESSGPDLDQLRAWADAGKLRSIIDSEFTLDEIIKAHERSQGGRARGKIVVKIR
jgi:NADPH:quinone reductase-like Zn-dependent oxidoreductase